MACAVFASASMTAAPAHAADEPLMAGDLQRSRGAAA
jgi:hypothetical protein